MFENITPESLKADALSKLPNWNKIEGSFADITVAGVMYELWKWYGALSSLAPIFYIDETSGEYIDRRCSERGITRKPGETDADLVARYYAFLRKPATSGNVYHYEQWALEVPGTGFVKVFEEWAGSGTVKVVVAGPDGLAVDGAVVEAVYAHIESERPIGAKVTAVSAEEFSVNIAAAVRLSPDAILIEASEIYAKTVAEHLKTLVFTGNPISYSRLMYLLLDTPGIADVIWLTVNGGTESLSIDSEHVPVVRQVEVSQV